MAGPVPCGPGPRLHPRRPHQLGRWHRHPGHADQLLRAAGRRQRLRRRGRQAQHLQGAGAGGRDHASRWRRRLRLQPHPPTGCDGQGHALERLRAGELHACLRPLLRDGRVGRRAPRCPDGHPALRPPRPRRVHPRQGRQRPGELQHLGRRHGCVHAGRRRRRRIRTGAPGTTGCGPDRARRPPAPVRRTVGLPHGPRPRADERHRARDLRPCRPGRGVPGSHEPGEQPLVRRGDRGDEPVQRAIAARLRLLLPRLHRPHAVRRAGLRVRCRLRLDGIQGRGPHRRAHAGQRARGDLVAAARAAPRSHGQAPHRPGLPGPGQRAGDARHPLRLRTGVGLRCAGGAGDARRGVPRFGRSGRREGGVSGARCGALPAERVRQAPA